MIPKIIHFCWLSGDKYPEKIAHCINSWEKYLPDYEIRLWDLSRFDIDKTIWCKEAFVARKYAFAADYIRCYALYNEGGIYLDSDVEVLKSFDDLLALPYFIGQEQGGNIEPAVMGCEKGWPLMGEMLDYYKGRHFTTDLGYDMATLPNIMSDSIHVKYILCGVDSPLSFVFNPKTLCVFPAEYFSPKFPNSFKCPVTPKTYTIHHFAASWYPTDKKIFRWIRCLFGFQVAHWCSITFKHVKSMMCKCKTNL